MKIVLYYIFRINKIFAKNLKFESESKFFSIKNLYISFFLPNIQNTNQGFFFINNFFIFKKFFLKNFLLKKLNYKKINKKRFFFFFKKEIIDNNIFKNKNSFNFIFKNNFLKNNFFFKKENNFFFEFYTFFILYKIFFSRILKNFLKIITNEYNDSFITCYYFKYLNQFFNYEHSVLDLNFFNIEKITDFWNLNLIFENTGVKDFTIISNFLDSFHYDFTKIALKEKKIKFNYMNLISEKTNKVKNFVFKKKSDLDVKKNKIYNKGRFSRNRQTYRTGTFLCIWLTVLTVLGFYFYFYYLSIKFTFFYFFFIFFIFSFFYKYYINVIEKH